MITEQSAAQSTWTGLVGGAVAFADQSHLTRHFKRMGVALRQSRL